MNRLTLMQMQAPAQHHDSRMKLTVTNSSSRAYSETTDRISSQSPALQVAAPDIPPLPSSDSCSTAGKFSLKSPSNPVLRSLDCNDTKANDDAVAVVMAHYPERGQRFMMHIMIDADYVTQLRHLVMGTCGELVAFMRIQPVAHATKMKVWLCLGKPAIDLIMDAVMHSLPKAEFGPVTRA
jgi:hypothetical protein